MADLALIRALDVDSTSLWRGVHSRSDVEHFEQVGSRRVYYERAYCYYLDTADAYVDWPVWELP